MTQEKATTSRRDILKIAGTTAPAAVLVAVATGTKAEAADVDLTSETMQDTVHTRAYFDSARF